MKRRGKRRIIGMGCGVGEEGRVRRRKNCKSAVRRGTVCGGCRWSAVVRCKSPSTAFNYDVIANTDDGYFLRYTLYITRGPTASTPAPVPKAVESPVCVRPYVLTTKPCDCFRMFQYTAPETRFSPTLLSDSLTPCLDPPLNVHLE